MGRQTRYTSGYSNNNRMSDQDILHDLLITEKQVSHMYESGIMEAANNVVRDTFEEFQHDEHENARTLFHAMQQRGWYSGEKSGDQQQQRTYDNEGLGRSLRKSSHYAVTSVTGQASKRFGSRLGSSNNRVNGKNGIFDY